MSSNFSLDSSNVSSSAEPSSVQILYDGDCPNCDQEIAFWQERYRTRSPLRPFQADFIDVSKADSDPAVVLGIPALDCKGKMLIRLPNGEVLHEQEVFQYLEQQLGLGFLYQVARWPGLGALFRGWSQAWVTQRLPYTRQWSSQLKADPLIVEPSSQAGVGEPTIAPREDTGKEIKDEIKDETEDEIKDETGDEIKDETGDEIKDETEDEIKDETGDEIKDEISDKTGGLSNLEQPLDSALETILLDELLRDVPPMEETSILEGVENFSLDFNLDLGLDVDLDDLDLDSSFCIIDNIESSQNTELAVELNTLESPTSKDFHDFQWRDLEQDESYLDLAGLSDLEFLERMLEPDPTDSSTSDPTSELIESMEVADYPEHRLEVLEPFHVMDTFIESAGNSGGLGMPIGNIAEQVRHLPPGRTDQTMKVPVRQLDSLSNLIAEMVVSRNCMESEHDRLRQFLTNLLYQMQQLSDVGQRFQDLYERSLLENALIASRQSFSQSPYHSVPKQQQHKFDALEMDHFSEFHLLSQEMIELIVRARESASDIDYVINEPLDYIARHFRQVTTQVQEGLNRTRMVPFEQGTLRLPRAIREVAFRSGKEACLVVEGKDILVDKVLLEQLYDPLTHLITNAVIHGIEPPEERKQLGKNPCGTITIRAFYQGNQTVIVVKDDGAGIDAERVRMKALQKGLINLMQAQTLKDIDMFDLIFNPGFSTRDQADAFAGRGVGMDVVKTRLDSIRGTISVDSTKGKGTHFTIRLPLTLSVTRALCCISNRARIAFPMDSIEDMLDIHEDDVKKDRKQRNYIQWRDQKILFKPLPDLLKYNRSLNRSTVYSGSSVEDDLISVIILRTTGDYLALQVDWVEGEKEIVIKQLESPIPKPPGIAGVTVLSDGHVLPIADVLELAEMSRGRLRQPLANLWKTTPPLVQEPAAIHQPVVLIVDDSITVRELLSMTFKKGNYRVEQARDGREAWEKLRSGLPCDLIFCDIEMPRMTGLELLEKLQRSPDLKKIPIAMLTSRGADRHRQLAMQLGAKAYFTKPYLEEMLLEAAQRMLKET